MASPISPIECPICSDEFNNTTCRPKVLRCGHSFCGPCLQRCMDQDIIVCSSCRTPHNATSVDSIPVNIGMENVMEKLNQMQSISVIFTQVKHNILKEAQQNMAHLESVTNLLDYIVEDKNCSIVSMELQIKTLRKTILEDHKAKELAQDDLFEINCIYSHLKECIEKVETATEHRTIFQQYAEFQKQIDSLRIVSDDIVIKNNIGVTAELLRRDPIHAGLLLRTSRMPIHAVDNLIKVCRASKVEIKEGSLDIAAMEKDVSPAPDSCILPLSSLLDAAGTQPVVYFGLEVDGKAIGRITLCLTCGPRSREQMLRLFMAQEGATWKGSAFSSAFRIGKEGECIGCQFYTTPNGGKGVSPIIHGLERDHGIAFVEGAVTRWQNDVGFCICTRTDPSLSMTLPKIGYIVSGLDLLRQAIGQLTVKIDRFTFNARQIKIAETGVMITM